MSGVTIGKDLNFGFAGNYARHPEQMNMTRRNGGTTNIVFGDPVMLMADGASVQKADATFTAENFDGVAAAEVKSELLYLDQNSGGAYVPNEPVPVFQRGSISVLCPDGNPVANGAVYVRIVASGQLPVGSFSANDVSGETVLIPNARWNGGKDTRNIVELVLLTRTNA